ncbi:MAG: TIGR02757 family protein [Deltaproteobacteria bacterium CG11_big_fil_rev_8_21_14_0_20_45_16]|nr:MAG: TIGR02757 family protein [Deltaproteobacteria bacterium CG11_big_fil_rev_8_21_14_0_20_45_16]
MPKSNKIKNFLEHIYHRYNSMLFLEQDPLFFAHQYQTRQDKEFVAWLSACLAYGNVRAMMNTIQKILDRLGPSPTSTLRDTSEKKTQDLISGLYYRFYTESDIGNFLIAYQRTIKSYGSLEESFLCKINARATHVEKLSRWRSYWIDQTTNPSRGYKFFFPDPAKGSAKRLHMFLRWMVRKDKIDLGLWSTIRSNVLIAPLDTHVFEWSKFFGWTKRSQPDRLAAMETTRHLHIYCPKDPLRYDFALCRTGVLREKAQLKKLFNSGHFDAPLQDTRIKVIL